MQRQLRDLQEDLRKKEAALQKLEVDLLAAREDKRRTAEEVMLIILGNKNRFAGWGDAYPTLPSDQILC